MLQVRRACNKHTYVLHEQRELELDFVFIATHHGHYQPKYRLNEHVRRACNKHTYVLHEQRELELDFVFIATHHGHYQPKYRLNEHVINTHTCCTNSVSWSWILYLLPRTTDIVN
ncbi:hypothetical protein PUN28_020874 [Cardiocondyla obscurior]|uniref:Uncharacterized protein n=1 Tax=Cardiocondyla obscurior TaxID=286306 RepID=A0AAW2E824_9HYME